MVVRKRKRRVKMRGSKFHGFAKKKHRGGGSKGGRGMAGSGKRAGQQKMSVLKEFKGKYFGKVGFTSIHESKEKYMNIRDLSDEKEINLTKLGYSKLLGKGNISRAVKIIVREASKGAIKKIEDAKGEVVLEKNGSV